MNLKIKKQVDEKLKSIVDETNEIANYMQTQFGKSLETFKQKNVCYGNSFLRSARRYGIESVISRLYDKFNRLESLTVFNVENKQDDESIEDTLIDLSNYCMMLAYEFRKTNKEQNENETKDDCALDDKIVYNIDIKKLENDIIDLFVLCDHKMPSKTFQRKQDCIFYSALDSTLKTQIEKAIRAVIYGFLKSKSENKDENIYCYVGTYSHIYGVNPFVLLKSIREFVDCSKVDIEQELDSIMLFETEEKLHNFFKPEVRANKFVFEQKYHDLFFDPDASFLNPIQRSVRRVIYNFLISKGVPLESLILLESKESDFDKFYLLDNIIYFTNKYVANVDSFEIGDKDFIEESELND